ncbi:unnamed protein product [Meganyctiphanes norvegica]|uniref:Uncharacterized protein n=1 Tax=Meganyctiphanes norvegica TaxID=48144 RepID=A0AAV2RAZ2_MEGNR
MGRHSKDLKSYRKKINRKRGRPCKKTPAKESKCHISDTQIKFGSTALGKICNVGENNKIYKKKGWGEFQLIFGNRIPDKSEPSDIGRKMKYTYLSVALQQDNVSVLEQKLEHLQLKPKKQTEFTATGSGDCNKENVLNKCSVCGYKLTDYITML